MKSQQVVSFRLGNEEFGVNILKVQEIMRLQEITRVPQTPDFMEGVINLRGNVIPIIDLRKKFVMESRESDNLTRIIVVNVQDKVMGIIVDAVEQVLRLTEEQVEPPPDVGLDAVKEYLMGVGKLESGLLILLNLDRILTEEEKVELNNFSRVKNAVGETKKGKTKKENKKKEEVA
jgi:purine-binding chemotaxis protein CheW